MNRIFEDGEYLNNKQLIKRANISQGQWDANREYILQYLSLFIDFEILGTNPHVLYHIIHQFAEYVQYTIKLARQQLFEEDRAKDIIEYLSKYPIATYENIQKNLGISLYGQAFRQLRRLEKIGYCKVVDRVWCREINGILVKINQDKVGEFLDKSLMGFGVEVGRGNEQIRTLYEDRYDKGIKEFWEKYGYEPFLANVYAVKKGINWDGYYKDLEDRKDMKRRKREDGKWWTDV